MRTKIGTCTRCDKTTEEVVVRDFPIPLLSGGIAVVKVPVPMTEDDFSQLTGTLQAWKKALTKQDKGKKA